MRQYTSYADTRLVCSCVFCGASTQTRDHCPSKIFLDEPYPENLPVVPACASCNTGFSLDEQYFACFLESVIRGSADLVQRPKIKRLLHEVPSLYSKIKDAKRSSNNEEQTFDVEHARIQAVVLKLARGHAAYETSEIVRHDPSHVMIVPLQTLSASARLHFETPPSSSVWPEVGSRAMQRMFLADGSIVGPQWIDVQEGRYRYFVIAEGNVMVRSVISEYLACEVIWSDDGALDETEELVGTDSAHDL